MAFPHTAVIEQLGMIALAEELFTLREACSLYYNSLVQPHSLTTYVKDEGFLRGHLVIYADKNEVVAERLRHSFVVSSNRLIHAALADRKIYYVTKENECFSIDCTDKDARVVKGLVSTPKSAIWGFDEVVIPVRDLMVIRIEGKNLTFADWFIAKESAVVAASMLAAVASLDTVAKRDPLTGLQNRGHFELLYRFYTSQFLAKKQNTGVLMLDIDHFKTVNDKNGHNVGDQVLKHVTKAAADALRVTDSIGEDGLNRYGGEEFIMLLPGADYVASTIAAQRCRIMIEQRPFFIDGEAWPVTASFGVTTLRDVREAIERGFIKLDRSDDPELFKQQLMNTTKKVVDDLLYKAKNGGRNRVAGAYMGSMAGKREYIEIVY